MNPIHAQVLEQFRREGLQSEEWSNGPGAVYAVHDHPYAKVLYVIEGSIEFHLPASRRTVPMRPGERLDIPPHTPHRARVGPHGVTCLEAHRAG